MALTAGLALSPAAIAQDLPVVKVFATGGTIANTPDGRIGVEVIVEQLPEALEVADIRYEDISRVASQDLTWQEFIDTAKAIERSLAEEGDIDGIVVTIGSNASEEMAYFLNLVLDTDTPVVVTAAQRRRGTLSEDASRNFIDALITASSPAASGHGALLVVNEEIHAARDATKNVVSRVDSWQSLGTGPLGIISYGEPVFYRAATRRHTTDSEFSLDAIESAEELPKVEIVYSYISANPRVAEWLVAEEGAEGIVMAAFATGSAAGSQLDAMSTIANDHGVPVVIANRGSTGRMANRPEPWLAADNLSPQKAHMLLMMALTVTEDHDEIARIFAEY